MAEFRLFGENSCCRNSLQPRGGRSQLRARIESRDQPSGDEGHPLVDPLAHAGLLLQRPTALPARQRRRRRRRRRCSAAARTTVAGSWPRRLPPLARHPRYAGQSDRARDSPMVAIARSVARAHRHVERGETGMRAQNAVTWVCNERTELRSLLKQGS